MRFKNSINQIQNDVTSSQSNWFPNIFYLFNMPVSKKIFLDRNTLVGEDRMRMACHVGNISQTREKKHVAHGLLRCVRACACKRAPLVTWPVKQFLILYLVIQN